MEIIESREKTEYSMKDCHDEYMKHEKEMADFFTIDNDSITLQGYYHISKDRCVNYESILNWVLHLSEKPWMDARKLNRFIKIACGINKLPFPQERD